MIPINTTTITVKRVPPDPDRDPEDPEPAATNVATGVRAVIASPTGRERNLGGTQEIIEFALSCDPVDLEHTDQVVDDVTGVVYSVIWVTQRKGFGMDHTRAGLRSVHGIAR